MSEVVLLQLIGLAVVGTGIIILSYGSGQLDGGLAAESL